MEVRAPEPPLKQQNKAQHSTALSQQDICQPTTAHQYRTAAVHKFSTTTISVATADVNLTDVTMTACINADSLMTPHTVQPAASCDISTGLQRERS